MTFHLKSQWAYAFAAFATATVYFVWLGTQLASTAATDIDYRSALLWTIGASMIIHALGTGMVRGSMARGADTVDDRDREITRRGDAISFYLFSSLAAIPLALGLWGVDTFWITNSLFAAFAFTAVAGVVIKALYYWRGV